jgi:glyoxylase-like metal-dependent hydrolase (beta-lactamase superfamily II)
MRVGRCRHPEWVTIRGGRFGAIDFPALAALIVHPSAGPILYDTGYADHFAEATKSFPGRIYRWLTPVHLPEAEQLTAQLHGFGVAPGDISRVLISHLHADHVAGLRDLPRARFVALEKDIAAHLGPNAVQGFSALRRGVLPALLPPDFGARLDLADACPAIDLGPTWAPFSHGYDLIGEKSLIGIPLPGHSPAQLGVLLRTTDDAQILLAADSCWSARAWKEQRLPSFLARPLFADWTGYRATLAGLKTVAAQNPDLRIVPSHCTETFEALRSSR